ncbi:MAG: hypothetical protein IIV08_06105, partial [Selenomonadales bacterium]|nr:hypothetical protein [Selenomonadales bacterium]
MNPELKELIEDRQHYVYYQNKNKFTEGLHALLTDIYPDTAHFIYELLQNAEDMDATTVRFFLHNDRIDFEHNGTKRAFNIADIEAITNIGHNSQKKNDPTSIGKFGVGFKAVFAYTATPIIHSGEYHFKIREYFIPDFKDVPHVNTTDDHGIAWTKFSFPFNNPKKPSSIAYRECLNGLNALNSSSVLFLRNIHTIEYRLPSAALGYVKRIEQPLNHITINYQNPNNTTPSTSHWLRFQKTIDITNEEGHKKRLPIAIAFALEIDEQTQTEKIVP